MGMDMGSQAPPLNPGGIFSRLLLRGGYTKQKQRALGVL
jgi:hypothetical protein